MRFNFTRHAVERYVKRIDPSLDYTSARKVLEDHAALATKTKAKTCLGQEQFIIHELGCILVCKFDAKVKSTNTTVVTILGLKEEYPDYINLNEHEPIIQKVAERHPAVARAFEDTKKVEITPQHTELCSRSIAASEEVVKVLEKLHAVFRSAQSFDEEEIQRPLKTKMAQQDERIHKLEREAREAQNALRIAVRGLFGETPAAQALEAIAMINLNFIDDDFYKNARTVFELAEQDNHEDRSCI